MIRDMTSSHPCIEVKVEGQCQHIPPLDVYLVDYLGVLVEEGSMGCIECIFEGKV